MATPEDPRQETGAPGSHVDDDLLALLAMEGPDVLDAASRSHVDACSRCAGELEALRETLALVVAGREETMVAPPASVWEGVLAGIRAEGPPAGGEASADPSGATPAGGGGRTPGSVTPLAPRRGRVPTWLAAVAASVTLVAGIGVGVMVATPQDQDPDDPAPSVEVLGNASLASLEETPEDRGAAEVRRHDDRVVLHVEASDLDGPDRSDGTREVWLINVDGTRMVSLGLLPPGEKGEFDFPERLLEQGYRIVDISYEPDDGDPVHSGQSLARGEIEG